MAAARAGPEDITIIPSTLCAIAKSDAKHDFGGGVNPGMLDSTLPPDVRCDPVSEDETLASIGINNVGHFFTQNDNFHSPYIVQHCNYEQLDTVLATFFASGNNFTNELGFIVDAYSGRFADFCKKINDGTPRANLKYYWIETPETVYDPAPKTRADTPAGRAIAGDNLIFASEVPSDNGMSHPIIHKKYDYSPIRALNGLSQDDRERMFYSNYTITQFSSVNSESITILSDTIDGQAKNIIVNENAAEIKQKNFDYKAYELLQSSPYKNTINKILNISIANPTAKLHTLISTKYRYPLKRLGDQGQALACLRSMIVQYPTPAGNVQKTFNQNLCFVTHDKIALASAIVYGVPAIVFCRQDGNFEIFINTIYRTPEQLLANARSKYENIYNLYTQQYTLLNTRLNHEYTVLETQIYGLIHQAIVEFINLLNGYNTLDVITEDHKNELDNAYKEFFKVLYRYRCDMLYYHSNLRTVKNIASFETPVNINRSDDINNINTHHAKLMKEYSNLDMQVTFIKNLFNRYIPEPGGSISRVPNAPNDEVTMSKLNELKLFTARRDSISQRTFRTEIARIIGIDFIHEYANALYYYRNTDLEPLSFLTFLEVFSTIRRLISEKFTNDTTLALGEILGERIIQIESYKEYKRSNPAFVFSGGNRTNNKTRKIQKRMCGGNPKYDVKNKLINNELYALEDYLKWLKVYAINTLTYYGGDEQIIRDNSAVIDITTVADVVYDAASDTTLIIKHDNSIIQIIGPVQFVCYIPKNYLPYFIDNPMKYSIHMYDDTSNIYNAIITSYNNNDLIGLQAIYIKKLVAPYSNEYNILHGYSSFGHNRNTRREYPPPGGNEYYRRVAKMYNEMGRNTGRGYPPPGGNGYNRRSRSRNRRPPGGNGYNRRSRSRNRRPPGGNENNSSGNLGYRRSRSRSRNRRPPGGNGYNRINTRRVGHPLGGNNNTGRRYI